MDAFTPATCELFGHLVFKGNKIYKLCVFDSEYLHLFINKPLQFDYFLLQ